MANGLGDGELETAVEMGAAVRAGAVTSVELVQRALDRIQEWEPSTNAFSQLWADEALEAARRVDSTQRRDTSLLAGVPIAVKDLFDVAEHETTGCCDAYRGRIASSDAPVIQRLRDARLVIVGKTNQHELAAGGTNTVSACGPAHNPWDPACMTGGSSGGSAAAVASGAVPMALGSDTGGSIRIPASLCGTFGLKPTYARFPLEGLMPLAPSMDCPGPMASTAKDLIALYRALQPGTVDGPAARPPPYRIGVPDGFFAHRVHDDVLTAVRDAATAFRSAGVLVRPVDGRGIEGVRSTWMEVCTAEFADAHPELQGSRLGLVSASVRQWLERGRGMSREERAEASMRREAIRAWFAERLEEHDALLVPTTPFAAPRIDAETVDLGSSGTVQLSTVGPGYLTCSVNLAGLPAVNLPAGRSGRLPVGVSLVGRPGGESVVLEMARVWERATEHSPARPPLPRP